MFNVFPCLNTRPVSFTEFSIYFRAFFPHLPPLHWLVMSVVSAAVIVMLIRRKCSSRGGCSLYNAAALGVTVFICLVLLDILLIHRFNAARPRQQCFNLLEEYRHIVSGDEEYAFTMLFNFLLFIPLGFSLSEYLSSRRIRPWKTLKYAVLFAFIFSLCCECLQYVFKVGISELTDVILNTLGALVGVVVSLLGRDVIRKLRTRKSITTKSYSPTKFVWTATTCNTIASGRTSRSSSRQCEERGCGMVGRKNEESDRLLLWIIINLL